MTAAVQALFAFVLSLGMFCQTTLALRTGPTGGGASCVRKCCGTHCDRCPPKCQSLGCCDRGQAPIPASRLANPFSEDWMTPAPTLALPSIAITALPNVEGSVFSLVPVAGVPLYLRNCAYLI